MLEFPETHTIARQARETFAGRKITAVFNATHPHKWTWWAGDPAAYGKLLTGKQILSAEGHGAFVDLQLDDKTHIAISDGVNLRYFAPGADVPAKYQLLLTLDNGAFLLFTVAMYGGIQAFREPFDNPYYQGALAKPSPLDEQFDAKYFEKLRGETKPTLSAKAFLATEQRIPGLGNGVLQDILFRAQIHPKRKLAALNDKEFEAMFNAVKSTLKAMAQSGGRSTEKDLFGCAGGYEVLLSAKSCGQPCPVCGTPIVKEAYMGGAVYYCPTCQQVK